MKNPDKFHRTAIKRKNISTPVKFLLKNEILDKQKNILDYGCGHGYDVKHLCEQGYDIVGYDPNGAYNDSSILANKYDIIICNYVLNVIEDEKERLQVEDKLISMLKDNGNAFISVRADKQVSGGYTSIGTWQGFVEPINKDWIHIKRDSKFNMWRYTK